MFSDNSIISSTCSALFQPHRPPEATGSLGCLHVAIECVVEYKEDSPDENLLRSV